MTEPSAQSVLSQIAVTVHHVLASSQQNLVHLKETRTFFDVGMARIAAVRAKPEDISDLKEILIKMEASASKFADFMKHDIDFHRRIAIITGNPIYVAVSEALLSWLSKYHIGELRKVGREAQTLAEHRHILDCIASHDVEGAAAAMQVHHTRAADLYTSHAEARLRS